MILVKKTALEILNLPEHACRLPSQANSIKVMKPLELYSQLPKLNFLNSANVSVDKGSLQCASINPMEVKQEYKKESLMKLWPLTQLRSLNFKTDSIVANEHNHLAQLTPLNFKTDSIVANEHNHLTQLGPLMLPPPKR